MKITVLLKKNSSKLMTTLTLIWMCQKYNWRTTSGKKVQLKNLLWARFWKHLKFISLTYDVLKKSLKYNFLRLTFFTTCNNTTTIRWISKQWAEISSVPSLHKHYKFLDKSNHYMLLSRLAVMIILFFLHQFLLVLKLDCEICTIDFWIF